MAAATLATIDTHHEDMIHDCQLNYYSSKLATCSSDRTIKIFDVDNSNLTQVADLKGHDGPVWQVAWAHPKFGSVLASCSYDRKVILWKETSNNQWTRLYEFDHESSVNSIAFAPHEFGLVLASASSDCSISVITLKADNSWDIQRIPNAHTIGVNAVSWAPAVVPGSLVSQQQQQPPTPQKTIVSGGCDNLVKIWKYSDTENSWKLEETLQHHTDWVRDVAWSPNIGLPHAAIASCSQDGTVVIWTQDTTAASTTTAWSKKILPKFPDTVWRVSWSVTGNILAVSGGDNKVTLWKEALDNEWKCISDLEDTEAATAVAH
jgi:protein transport protein SEC13